MAASGGRIKPRFERRRYRKRLPWPAASNSAHDGYVSIDDHLDAMWRVWNDPTSEDKHLDTLRRMYDDYEATDQQIWKRYYEEMDQILSGSGNETYSWKGMDDVDSIRTLSEGYESSEAWEPAGGWNAGEAGASNDPGAGPSNNADVDLQSGPSRSRDRGWYNMFDRTMRGEAERQQMRSVQMDSRNASSFARQMRMAGLRTAMHHMRRHEHRSGHASRGDTRSRPTKRRADFAGLPGEHPKHGRHQMGSNPNYVPTRRELKRKAHFAALEEEHGTIDRRQVRHTDEN